MATSAVHSKIIWHRIFIVIMSVSVYYIIWEKGIESVDRAKRSYVFTDNGIGQYHIENSCDRECNNWTILLTINDAFLDFFQNWLIFYRQLHIHKKIIIVAEDDAVYKKLTKLYKNYFTIERSSYNSLGRSAKFGSKEFAILVSARPAYILKYLSKGINIVYADTDSVWLQNPFSHFCGNYDMWMQKDDVNKFCTGLIALKSNNATLELTRQWYLFQRRQVRQDQFAFNVIVKSAKIRLRALDPYHFPSGREYFEQYTDIERSRAVVVHNNWIKGHDIKRERFRNYKLWKLFDFQS